MAPALSDVLRPCPGRPPGLADSATHRELRQGGGCTARRSRDRRDAELVCDSAESADLLDDLAGIWFVLLQGLLQLLQYPHQLFGVRLVRLVSSATYSVQQPQLSASSTLRPSALAWASVPTATGPVASWIVVL